MVHRPLNICTVPPYIVQYHPVVISVPTICHPVNDSLQKVLANVRLYYMIPYCCLVLIFWTPALVLNTRNDTHTAVPLHCLPVH